MCRCKLLELLKLFLVDSGPCMDLLVISFEGIFAEESLATITAAELRPGQMGHLVGPQTGGAVKTLTTLCATMASLIFVHFFMGSEMGRC